MVHACWWYYFSKFTEFMDTVRVKPATEKCTTNIHKSSLQIFFVLRKKTSQVTTLHVIHHGCMPLSVWFGVKFTPGAYPFRSIPTITQRFTDVPIMFVPGGHSTFFGLLNTFVHIVMYTYYMFSAMGPQYQKYLWWKKYLTTLQMVSHAFSSIANRFI